MSSSSRLVVLSAVLGGLLVATILVEGHAQHATEEAESAPDPHRSTRTSAVSAAAWVAPTAAPELASADSLRLEGQVVDNRKRPVAGATVTLGERTMVTEADGGFAFDGLVEGEYSVTAEWDGAYAEQIDARLDETSDPLELELARGPSLRVHVVDEAGKPVAGARVHTSSREAKTDAAGRAVLRAVDYFGEHFIVVADAYAETAVDVETGDDPAAVIEREVVLGAGTQVVGIVLDETGKPVDHAVVRLAQQGGDERSEREVTDEQGTFTFAHIGRGTYQLDAHSDDLTTGPAVALAVDGVTPARAVVRAVVGAEISGIVVDGQGRPVANADVDIGPRSTHTADDGTFTMRGLESGEIEIGAHSATLGMHTRTATLAPREHLKMRLVLAPASISGIVVDPAGRPVEDASVYARSEDPRGWAIATTDARGRFDLGGLPPGTYVITASRDDSRHEGPAVVADTGDHSVRVVLPERAGLTATVMFDGAPVRYFGYELLSPDDTQPWSPTMVRDATGTFTNDDAEPGTWNLAIVGPGFAARIIPNVQITAGRVTNLGILAVEHGRTLRGRVVDLHGAPVAGADVRVRGGFTNDGGGGLRALSRGFFITRSAADGTYRLDGISGLDSDAHVAATKDGVGNAEVDLGDQEVVDLTLVTAP